MLIFLLKLDISEGILRISGAGNHLDFFVKHGPSELFIKEIWGQKSYIQRFTGAV